MEPKSVLKSASVNGIFNFISDSTVVRDIPYIHGLDNAVQSTWNGYMPPEMSKKFDSRREKRGKITLYDRRNRGNKYFEISGLVGSYLNGADVLITPTPIKPNNNHGSMSNLSRAYSLLDNCGMVSITEDQFINLRDVFESGSKMQVVSDGLIAEVRVFETITPSTPSAAEDHKSGMPNPTSTEKRRSKFGF